MTTANRKLHQSITMLTDSMPIFILSTKLLFVSVCDMVSLYPCFESYHDTHLCISHQQAFLTCYQIKLAHSRTDTKCCDANL